MTTVKATLQQAIEALQTYSDSPRLDAELLLSYLLHWTRSQLSIRCEQTLTATQYNDYQALITRRLKKEPIAYLVGEKEFWSLALTITPAVLIPRPETELLVETVLKLITHKDARIADLGTGSGAIALALAQEQPKWQLIATDSSLEALEIAHANAKRHQLNNVSFRQGCWTEALLSDERFDAVLSNPPYLAVNDPHLMDSEISHEPRGALVADEQGLADYLTLSAHAMHFLKPEGYLVFEHGCEQAPAIQTILQRHGFSAIQTVNDLAGLDRVTYGRWQP